MFCFFIYEDLSEIYKCEVIYLFFSVIWLIFVEFFVVWVVYVYSGGI